MKKYLFITVALFISTSFTSCDKEAIYEEPIELEPISDARLCIKRTVERASTLFISGNTKIYEYTYTGSRLLNWTLTRIDESTTSKETYDNTYKNGLITSMSIYNTLGRDDSYDFEYDSADRVIKQIKNNVVEFTYIYIGNSVEKYDSSGELQVKQTYDEYDNMIQRKSKNAINTWEIVDMTHDDKNMAFKNVDILYPTSPFRYKSSNNFITQVSSTDNWSLTRDITYDLSDFPTEITTYHPDGMISIETLEYNK